MPARVASCGDDQVRLREKTIAVGIAAAGPHEREDEQCLETRFGGVTDLGEDHVRRRGRIRPRATVELEPNAQGEKRQSPEIELEAVAVREPGLDPACGRLVRAPGSRTEREVVHGVRGELREPQLPCLVEVPLQQARFAGAEQLDSPELDRGIDALLGAAEPTRELQRPLAPGNHARVISAVRRDQRHRRRRVAEERAFR